MIGVLRKKVNLSFERAVEHVERVVKDEGFGVLLTKSIDEMLIKKLGLKDYPRYTLILVCTPKIAKIALDISKDVSTLFPCSFVVYEDNNSVYVSHVSIMKIAAMIGLAPAEQMTQVIKKTEEKVQAVWKRLK